MQKIIILLICLLILGLTNCQGNGTPPVPTSQPDVTSIPTYSPVPSPLLPSLTPTTATTPTRAPTPTSVENFSNPKLVILAEGLPEPDDLLVGKDGAIYISDVKDGSIRQINPGNGAIQVILSGLSTPEGMILSPDGLLIIAEQGKNRLLRWNPATNKIETMLNLENKTGRLGVDGLALDDRPGKAPDLIIPDSPNNRVLRASLDGLSLVEIAHGLNRPTGAWVERDGSILVVEENGGSLDRIHPDGKVDQLSKNLPTPDDVVEDSAGNIFIVTLGDNALHWISTAGEDRVLAGDFSSPQGLALDSNGNPLIADSGHHRVVKIVVH